MNLRVALLSHHYPLHDGDWKAPFVVARAQALAKRCDVTVVHAVPWMSGLPADAAGPVPVRRARYLYVPGVGKRFDGRLLAHCAREAVAGLRPDVLEAQFGYPDGEAAVAVAREIGCVAAVALRGTEQILARDPARRDRIARTLRAADLVVPVSQSLADFALAHGARAGSVRVVENGVDGALFHPGDAADARRRAGLPPVGRLLLGVGHFLPAKGYADLLEAFAQLARDHADVHLVLVGSGPGESALRAAADRLGVGGRVHWPGTQAHERIPEFLRAADLFVHPSHSEGRPNAVLEAQACGLPAVATDVGGTREVVLHGETGWLVPPRDPVALAAAIRRALREPFDRAVVARHGGARTWDDTARVLVDAYTEAVGRRAAAPAGR